MSRKFRQYKKRPQKIPPIDVERYLRRIDYDAVSLPNLDYLKKLHKAHLLTIPFENLDIHWNREIVLDLDRIYQKVIVNKRGGFCYELNGLFYALLMNLGFKCHLISCRVYNDDNEESPEYDHMAIIVEVDGKKYLADVGFGELFLEPKELAFKNFQVDYNKYFKFMRQPKDEFVLLSSVDASTFKKEYIFSLQVKQFIEFIPRCTWQQTAAESHFTQKKLCSIATPEGRITLTDNKLLITVRGVKHETALLNADDFNSKLLELFNIHY